MTEKNKKEVQLIVSTNIIKYREKIGMSQEELSIKAQIPLELIMLLENGLAEASLIVLNKLAIVLNTTPNDLKTSDTANLCVKINELFSLFHQTYSLEYEKMIKKHFSHIFGEYFGGFRTLDLKEFELLISKSSYKQIAIAFNSILFKCDNLTEIELLDKYSNEILTVFSLNIWFNNFEYGIDEIFKEFPEFKKSFESKIEKGMFDMVTASSMWEMFLNGSSELQKKILDVAIRENFKRVSGSLKMRKRFAKMKA